MMSCSRSALIVQDQPFVGIVTSDILRESGFEIFHAFDATDAIDVLRSHPEIGLLVTEADLPGPLNGVGLAHQIASERADIQIVVTAAGLDLTLELPRGTHVLRKPFSSAELRALAPPRILQDA